MAASDPLVLLALNRLEFLKAREKLLLAELCGAGERLFSLSLGQLEKLLGRRLRTRGWKPGEALEGARADQKHLTAGGISCTFYPDADFPPQLKEIYDPPLVLFYRGRLPDPSLPLVAIVGTRRPTGKARSEAFALGLALAERGVPTVSGLARGIDSEAHRGSLAGGGVTIAVLGNGIDEVYPRGSVEVARRLLLQGGCLLSEYPPATPPLAYHFPARNRIISGLARTVVVIQAPEHSGALITADYALEQGRDLLVHEVGLEGVAGEGTRRLHCSGAPAVRRAEQILAEWGWEAEEPEPELAPPPLARQLELELAGRLAHCNGMLYLKRRT